MGMESTDLIPAVRQLPSELDASGWDYAEMIRRIRSSDKGLFAIGVAQATEEALESLFEWRNVPDEISRGQAYERAWPTESQETSLVDNYIEALEGGSRSVGGFVSNFKGKVAEIQTGTALEERFPGYDFSLGKKYNEPGYDLHGTSPDGPDIFVEVKARAAGDVHKVAADMMENPDIPYAVSTDIWLALAEKYPDLLERIIYLTGPVKELTEFTKDGLDTLAGNMGLDVPDSVGEALPFAAEVVLVVRLLMSMRSTERELEDVDRGDINRVHGVRALALVSKYGVNQLMMAGGAGWGALVGSLAPGPGTAIGGIAGGAAGLGYGIWLNRQIEPYIEQMAVRLVGGDADDMFYLMNKPAIESLGESFVATSAAP